MPLYSLLVSMPAETAAQPPSTRLPTLTLRAGGSRLADGRALRLRKEGVPGVPEVPGGSGAAGSGKAAARVGPLRGVVFARDAAKVWLRRAA